MLSMNSALRLLLVALLPGSLVACIIEDSPPRRLAPEPAPYDPAPSGDPSAPPPPSASPAPMLVEVDTDQTMTAEPGQGVGVFVEYGKGGRWRIWWTCDTAKTRQDCDFNVSASVAVGNISEVDASQLAGGFVTTPTPSRVEARVRTAQEVHGIAFSTNPGAVITLEATVGGLKDGSFLFFVQDGKVNGGYQGVLTNPLQLQGKTP